MSGTTSRLLTEFRYQYFSVQMSFRLYQPLSTWTVWLYHNETINDIVPCLLNQIQWITYLTACLDVPYDIADPDVDLNELF